tara:strand:- start:623 stop:1345 length:723 start_codon:yes stop_codon:yes gene_type:complete
MPIFDDDSDFPIPTWTMDDVEVLEAIDFSFSMGIVELLRFLIAEKGSFTDETLDLTIIVHSVVNALKDQYTFDEAQSIVSVASEFCLIDCLYDNQNLVGMELSDNSILYLALQEEDDLALEAGVCRADVKTSLFYLEPTRPALSLFGHWEDMASELLFCMLTRGKLSDTIGSTYKQMSAIFRSDLEFVDFVRKMCEVGLISTEIQKSGKATIEIQVVPAGIFLLFSSRTELATKLAHLTI